MTSSFCIRSPGSRPALAFLILLFVLPAILLFVLPAQLAPQTAPTTAFHDLVARTNPELAALETRLAAARVRAAGSGLAPPLVLSGEVEDVPRGVDVTGATLRLEVGRELLTGGRSQAVRALAAAAAARAEAELASGAQRLAGETHRAIWRVLGSLGAARRLAAQDSLLVEAEAALTARFASGSARYVDVLRVRTERLRVQNDMADVIAEDLSARATLLALVGLDGVSEAERMLSVLVTQTDISALPAPRPSPPLDSLMTISGAVRVAESLRRIRDAEVAVTRSAVRSRFAVSGGLQRSVEAGRARLGPVIGVSVSLPFSAGHANRASIEAAEMEASAEAKGLRAVRARVRGTLTAAHRRYEAARARLEVYDDALLQGARDEREGALSLFRSGELSLLELLDFEQALARAEIERLRARIDAADAYANLIAAGSTLGDAARQE